jgi:hypothetical protein
MCFVFKTTIFLGGSGKEKMNVKAILQFLFWKETDRLWVRVFGV